MDHDVQLSKRMSHALRHEPQLYGLTPDEEGWVQLSDLVNGLALHRTSRPPTVADVTEAVATSPKRRFDLVDGRIRAAYGHSFEHRVQHPAERPPDLLFHGTTPAAWQSILREGIRPMSRQNVHLSLDPAHAELIARRRTSAPVIVSVRSGDAYDSGVWFARGNDDVWLSDEIPPAFLSLDG